MRKKKKLYVQLFKIMIIYIYIIYTRKAKIIHITYAREVKVMCITFQIKNYMHNLCERSKFMYIIFK
jgi:hypothetical protein